MKLIRTVLLLAFPFYFISCGTQKPLPNYLENITDSGDKKEVKIPELRIQKFDILSIQVFSASTKPEVSDVIYNLPSASQGQGGSANGGFLVDAKGNIQYPRLGSFHAEGLTKDELAAQIMKRLTEPVKLLEDPTVIIRFQNLKITVMGEVNYYSRSNRPGGRY
jgi:polysaccharide export outer membrane protein